MVRACAAGPQARSAAWAIPVEDRAAPREARVDCVARSAALRDAAHCVARSAVRCAVRCVAQPGAAHCAARSGARLAAARPAEARPAARRGGAAHEADRSAR